MLAATLEAGIPVPPHTTNGDETRYPDKSGTYSKGLLQDGYGRVNLNAFQTLKTALNSGNPSDFERIILGGTRLLNGPQGALAFGLEGTDAVQFGNAPSPRNQESVVIVPPPPAVASAAYGTESAGRGLPIRFCQAPLRPLLLWIDFPAPTASAIPPEATAQRSAGAYGCVATFRAAGW